MIYRNVLNKKEIKEKIESHYEVVICSETANIRVSGKLIPRCNPKELGLSFGNSSLKTMSAIKTDENAIYFADQTVLYSIYGEEVKEAEEKIFQKSLEGLTFVLSKSTGQYALSFHIERKGWDMIASHMERKEWGEYDCFEGEIVTHYYWVIRKGHEEEVAQALCKKTAKEMIDSGIAEEKAEAEAEKNRQANTAELDPIVRYFTQKFNSDKGEYIKNANPHGEQIFITGEQSFIYGGGFWAVISQNHLWLVQGNGADGDDWSLNNVETGGAGAIGKRFLSTNKDVGKLARLAFLKENPTAPAPKPKKSNIGKAIQLLLF